MFDEMAEYFDDILSKYQCGFRKDFSYQYLQRNGNRLGTKWAFWGTSNRPIKSF